MKQIESNRPTVAIILAGAVAKGAFEAGALSVIADANVRVARIVAASSGALNGTYFAAAVRARRERAAAKELIELWEDHAAWSDVVHVNLADVASREGLSDSTKLHALLARSVRPTQVADPAPINLRLVVAPLAGAHGSIGSAAATTYEQVLEFDGPDFDDDASLDRMFTAAVASAAFPGLFAPAHVPDLGACVDGGTVNNTPIAHTLDGTVGASVDTIVVISATPLLAPPPRAELRGADLAGHLVEMLINERLYRDLREAEHRNQAVAALQRLGDGALGGDQIIEVKRAHGWERVRPIQIVQIRPLAPLPGNSFSGFHDAACRSLYVRAGAERAQRVVEEQLHGG